MRNWYYFNWLCGDHIVEQHIHNLDVINWLKRGYPIRAEGMGGRQVRTGKDFGEIFDHHAVEFEYADGSRMFSYCRHIPNCWDSVTEHAIGTHGTADLSAGPHPHQGLGRSGDIRGEKKNPYQVEHDDLFASIRAGSPLNEAENGALSSHDLDLGTHGDLLRQDDHVGAGAGVGHQSAPKEYAWTASPPTPVVATPGVTQVV